ncbi:MAG TPA: efflux RND transporter permease subunit, partial [Kofleriaceae bacterium]|nr:efflux RND transporter permease subunit [Kofleriaceae bacterium]
MKIADISIRRPVFATMIIAALVVVGAFSYPRIGVDLFPNVEFPVVTVTVVYPGADPGSMESEVADPIEETVNTMAGIKTLRSVNLEGVTQVFVEFELDVSADRAAQDIRDRISAIRRDLPTGIDPPIIQKFDIGSSPIMSIALSGNLPIRELTRIADDVVKQRVQRVTGVGSVELLGGREREIHVLINPAKIAGINLTVEDVANALRAQNLELPAGHIEIGKRELTVKTKGEVTSTKDIANILIPGTGTTRVKIADVAEVVDTAEEARSYSAMNGKSAVALVVRKQSGSNTVEVANEVAHQLEELSSRLKKKGVTVAIPSDTSTFVERSINDVQFDLLFGALLAVVIILVFLHDFRATLISALAIPASVIATFGFIQVMGFTLNNMTMLALSLSIGILIDDAIVVIENIHRHRSMGKSPVQAAGEGTGEIGLAVLATTASILAVFLPVAFMKGIIGRFFFQFGLTVSFAVAVSALVSFTLTPMLASRLLKHAAGPRFFVFRFSEWVLGHIEAIYRVLLRRALRHRLITLIIAFLSLVAAVVLVTKVKTEFIPPEDREEFQVNFELPSGSSLSLTKEVATILAKDLRNNAPGVESTFITVGGGAQAQVNRGTIHAIMSDTKSRSFSQLQAMAWVRARFADLDNVLTTVVPVDAIGGGGGFRSQPIQLNIRGPNLDELNAVADKIIAELDKVPGFVDLDKTYRGGKPELAIHINRDRAAALGVPVSSIATTIRALIAGDKVTELKDGLDIYDVTMQLPEAQRATFANLGNLKVRAITGQLIDLANVVTVKHDKGPSQIERQARQRQVTVLANLDGIALGEALPHVEKIAAEVVPDDMVTDQAGMGEVFAESFGYMLLALALAVI